ncbi:MAG: universal stress protein [Gammaproteobacteria bacterium]
MSQFENVLVYAESKDPKCLGRVIEVVARHNRSLTICDVVEPVPKLPDPDGTLDTLGKLNWQRALERLRDSCRPHMSRLQIDYVVLLGNPFVAITEQVVRQRFDLVIHISDHQEDGASQGLSPTGMHLMRKCPCAVWSIPAGQSSAQDNIVLAIDRDLVAAEANSEKSAFELLAATDFAARADATVHVVHVWQPYAEALLRDAASGISNAEAKAYVEGLASDYQKWFERLVEVLQTIAPRLKLVPHLLRGDVTDVLLNLIEQTNASLCVIGTVGSTKVRGMLIGTTAEAILARSSAPVMTVKPHGFQTPLRFDEESMPAYQTA